MSLYGAALEVAHLESPAAPPPGWSLLYPTGEGLWRVMNPEGDEQTITVGPTPCRMTSSDSTTATSLSAVSGMSLSLLPGVWLFRFTGQYTTAGTGTGIGLGVDGPALDTEGLLANVMIGQTTVAAYVNTTTSYNSAMLATASAGSSRMPFELWGMVHVSAAGDLDLLFRSETSGQTVTIQAGSYGYAWKAG